MKYAFLADAPPMQHGGHANHSVAWSWSQAMRDHIGVVITRRFQRRIKPDTIRKTIGIPIVFYPDFSLLGLRRISDTFRCFLDLLLLMACLPWLVGHIRRSGSTRIFAFPSGWWMSLVNAWVLGKAAGLPVDVYMVDDLEGLAVLSGKRFTARMARIAEQFFLPRFAKVYTLSKGNAEHLRDKYGVRAEWLPLVIRADSIPYSPPPKDGEIRYIGFSGSMNAYYAAALTELNKVVVELNRTTPHRYKISLCIMPQDLSAIFPDTSVVEVFESLPNAQLVERLKLNYANFLPFSFAPGLRTMVSTSFSCKCAEYFAAGRPIIVYGPEYSSTARHFFENDLPLVCTELGGVVELISQVDRVDNPALIDKYRALIDQFHSPEALRRRLLPAE